MTNNNYCDEISQVVPFGKYEGLTLEEISEKNPKYILWLNDNCNSILIPRQLVDSCMFTIEDREDVKQTSIFDLK